MKLFVHGRNAIQIWWKKYDKSKSTFINRSFADILRDKELAEEEIYFRREGERLKAELHEKMFKSTEERIGHQLDKILGNYSVNMILIFELIIDVR